MREILDELLILRNYKNQKCVLQQTNDSEDLERALSAHTKRANYLKSGHSVYKK